MTSIDLILIASYFLGLLWIGYHYSRKVRANPGQMFVAGRQSPWWVSGLSSYMTMFSSGTFVVWGGVAYEMGFVAISIMMAYGVAAFLAGWTIASSWRRMGFSTAADFILTRYGERVFQFYTWFRIGTCFTYGLTLYALAVMVAPLIPVPDSFGFAFLQDPETGNLSVVWACIVLGAIIVTYTLSGGLWAVLMTDTIQFFVLTVSVILVTFLSLDHIGGIDNLIDNAPAGFFALTNSEFTWVFLFGWVIIHLFQIGAEWPFIQRHSCVPTEKDARKACYLFGFLYLTTPFLWMTPPMIYRILNAGADPEKAYILMSQQVLPAGMIGLMIAALFSATASMISSVLNIYSSVITEDVYKRLINPGANQAQIIRISRIVVVLLGIYMISGSLIIPMLTSYRNWLLVFASLVTPSLLLPTLWAIWSRHVRPSAVWWSLLITISIGLPAKLFLLEGSRVLDLAIGNLIPLAVLLFYEIRRGPPAEGYATLQQAIKRNRESEVSLPADGKQALRVISGALIFLAVLLFLAAVMTDEKQIWIGTTAFILVAFGGLTYRQSLTPTESTK